MNHQKQEIAFSYASRSVDLFCPFLFASLLVLRLEIARGAGVVLCSTVTFDFLLFKV
jgi:hypothetical protein